MSMSIYDKIKQYTTLKEVLNHYGYHVDKYYKCFCPFPEHNDVNTPNFTIRHREDPNFGKCHNCNRKGDTINIVKAIFELKNNYEAACKIINDLKLPITSNTILTNDKKEQFKYLQLKKRLSTETNKVREHFCTKIFAEYCNYYKISKDLLNGLRNKFTLEYQFLLFLNNLADKFCNYYINTDHKLETKYNYCLKLNKLLKERWKTILLNIPTVDIKKEIYFDYEIKDTIIKELYENLIG